MPENQQRICFASDVVLQVIDREALILKLHDEVVFSLNETGARIAQLIAERQPIDRLIDTLTGEFDTTRHEIEREVKRLVNTLMSRGLVIGVD